MEAIDKTWKKLTFPGYERRIGKRTGMRFGEIVFVYQMREEEDIRWHSRYHTHGEGEYELHYFIQGTGRFKHRGGVHPIQPGTIFLCGPLEMHSIIVPEDTAPLTYYAVLFQPGTEEAELTGLAQRLLNKGFYYRIKGNYLFYFEDLMEKCRRNNSDLLRSAEHQFISFLYLLTETGYEFHYTDSRNHHIEKALRLLQSSVFSSTTLDEISEKVGLDKSYFIRLFKKKMGTTPMHYLNRLKLDAARTMLMSTEQPIYTIAEKLNYYSEFHFSKAFKAYTGSSPRSFRKSRGDAL